jgi:hypothetical protein
MNKVTKVITGIALVVIVASLGVIGGLSLIHKSHPTRPN